MPFPKRLPAPIRYWKARLNIILQPAVWGGFSVLILLVLFSWEFWANSLVFDAGQTEELRSQVDEFSSQLTNEDNFIGADLDTMSSLIVDITRGSNNNAPNPGVNLTAPGNQAGPGLFSSVLAQNSNSGSSQSVPIPGAGPANSGTTGSNPLSQTPSFLSPALTTPGLGLSGPFVQPGQSPPGSPLTPGTIPSTTPYSSPYSPTYSPATAGATPPVSALQSAMTQYNQPQPIPSTSQTALPGFGQYPTSGPTSSFGQPPGFGQSSSPSTAGNSSFIDPATANSTVIDPQSLAPPPVPQSSLRSAPAATGSSSYSSPGTTSTQPSSSFANPNPAASTATPQTVPNNPPPFSVPNSVGNGEINTFSNP